MSEFVSVGIFLVIGLITGFLIGKDWGYNKGYEDAKSIWEHVHSSKPKAKYNSKNRNTITMCSGYVCESEGTRCPAFDSCDSWIKDDFTATHKE